MQLATAAPADLDTTSFLAQGQSSWTESTSQLGAQAAPRREPLAPVHSSPPPPSSAARWTPAPTAPSRRLAPPRDNERPRSAGPRKPQPRAMPRASARPRTPSAGWSTTSPASPAASVWLEEARRGGPVGVRRDAWGIPHVAASDVLGLARERGEPVSRTRPAAPAHAVRGEGGSPELWRRRSQSGPVRPTGPARRRRPPSLRFGGAGHPAFVSAFVDGVDGALQPTTSRGAVDLGHQLLGAAPPVGTFRPSSRATASSARRAAAALFLGAHRGHDWYASRARAATGAPLIAGDPRRAFKDPTSGAVRLT